MKRSLVFAFAIVLLGACSIKEIDIETPAQDDVVFYASFEQPAEDGTRVYANEDLLLRWTADDRVSIFNKLTYNQEYKFTGQTGANAGGFKKVDNDEFVTGNAISHVVSVYPYQESTAISESEEIYLMLPAEQHYAENTFGLGDNTMISVSADNVLQYKNVGGYLMLKLYGEGVSVSSITLKGNNGEKLAGKATVTMPLDGVPTVEMTSDATEEITLNCTTPVLLGATAEESTPFWFVVPPMMLSKGFTVTVKDDKNGVFVKSTTNSLEIIRNKLSKMSAIKTEMVSSFISEPLTIEAVTPGTLTWYGISIGGTRAIIEYSRDGLNWVPLTESDNQVSLSQGDCVVLRGENEYYATSQYGYSRFEYDGEFRVKGNIMSLIDGNNYENLKAFTAPYAFCGLFIACEGLLSAEDLVLPATELTQGCYWQMFYRCSHLTSAPSLPATKLADYCYYGMFDQCASLTVSPKLPAKEIAQGCYWMMFNGCSSLSEAPKLPATNLKNNCYDAMFSGCSSLKNAPDLPATVMAIECYQGMFGGCAIETAPELPAKQLMNGCYWNMFSGCTNLKTAPALPATTLYTRCYKGMFQGCSSLVLAPDLPATTLASSCYEEMFKGCSSLNYIKAMFVSFNHSATANWVSGVSPEGTFVKNAGASWVYYGADAIPTGWTVIQAEDDVNVIRFMTHKKGTKPVSIVVIPDGFTANELPAFRERAQEGINSLFSTSPYKQYKDYFNVYIIEVPSAESGVNVTDGNGSIIEAKDCFFGSKWGRTTYGDMSANDQKVYSFVSAYCPDIADGTHNSREVPIAILANDTRYGGLCISSSIGDAYCIIPYSYSGQTITWNYPEKEAASNLDDGQGYRWVPSSEIAEMGVSYGDWRNIFVHEFGGHAFGRLADEYWYGTTAASSTVPGHSFFVPFGLNVSDSYTSVPWQELLDKQQQIVFNDANYERIGVYQGGDVCMFGRWRNERISCMIDNRFYFSAWQRYLITKRIMTLSGDLDSFSFESWLSQDKTDDPIRDNISSSIRNRTLGIVHFEEPLLPPILIER